MLRRQNYTGFAEELVKKMKERLDKILVGKGFFTSREKAQAAIMAGQVVVDGHTLDKAGTRISDDADISIVGKSCPYVSRGGLKLEKALDEFDILVDGKKIMDVGASTGGFTDCLLKKGACLVYAVDVGYGQLDWSLRKDPRVIVMERKNIRYVKPGDIQHQIDLAVIDVSFISLKKVIPSVLEVVEYGGSVIALIKPQFEAGPSRVGKKGVVKDQATHRSVLLDIAQFLMEQNVIIEGVTYSPIKGPEGNIEYFICFQKNEPETKSDRKTIEKIDTVIETAHSKLN